MREWYAREENRQRVIDKVAARKRKEYAGTCLSCGGPTVGNSKNSIPEYCGKPDCKRVQMKRLYWGEIDELERKKTKEKR